jgi:hypothetical protein
MLLNMCTLYRTTAICQAKFSSTSLDITPLALPKILSEGIEKPDPQWPKSYMAILDIDLKIIVIGLKTNQNFSFCSLQNPDFMLSFLLCLNSVPNHP